MKRLPSGVSNYEKLITDNYYYVDKTEYIEKLEEYSNSNVYFLRPRKFGKTLFTDTLACYYNINMKNKFELLFGDTYIGKNPTKEKNGYHILKFNFSGIGTNTEDEAMENFKSEVYRQVDLFVKEYGLDFFVNPNSNAENIMNDLFVAFGTQRPNEKIYVIVDEYDHFANEMLSFNFNGFKNIITKNGKVRKWYEVLKRGTESVVGRIFITGVAPITLDSMTSGFNIADDLSRNLNFNSMMGFNEVELKKMMREQEISEIKQNELLPVMKEYYDGYMFNEEATEKLYNSNMCLYFLNQYIQFNKVPNQKVDVNIASDYSKIENMLKLCSGEQKFNILSKIISGEGIVSDIVLKFNPQMGFKEREMVSMLYYLGYLTTAGKQIIGERLVVPNLVMKEIYSDFFTKIIEDETKIEIANEMLPIAEEIAYTGKLEKINDLLHRYLSNLSNRDYIKFDEKYVKLIFYSIAMNLKDAYYIKSELEVNRNYTDLLLLAKNEENYSILIEFKYLKKEEAEELVKKQEEARKQLSQYAEHEWIKNIPKLKKYTLVTVVDEIYIEEVTD